MNDFLVFSILVLSLAMVCAKRINALINGFLIQSLFLALLTLLSAFTNSNSELIVVAVLLFGLKVVIIPFVLYRLVKKINAEGVQGLFINPMLSLLLAVGLVCLSYVFVESFAPFKQYGFSNSLAVSLSVVMLGAFVMIFRMKALSQVIGLLMMENGIFLAASCQGGMPFFVEIAIFFDVLSCVMILGIFIFRINSLFTHIEANRLNSLKG